MTSLRVFLLALLALVWLMAPPAALAEDVRIGVLAKRGPEQTLQRWQATADYLSENVEGADFKIVPLDFAAIGPAVAEGRVDFVLANSAIYVDFETRYGVSRIATLRNRNGDLGYTEFGGVLFTRADRTDINTLDDVAHKRFAAVDETSFGGFMMAWRELAGAGINPYEDTELSFEGTHDAVAYAVLDGTVDVGTVRTDTLERMAAEGKIDMARLKVINGQDISGFRYQVSTRLYPEWPFAKLAHTSQTLSHAVATALLQMPSDCCAAQNGTVAGWTVPRNYQAVHELMRELHLGPYADLDKITWENLLRQYWQWLLFTAAFIAFLVFGLFYIGGLNIRLRATESALVDARDGLARRVSERTAELEASRAKLERISQDWNDAFDAIDDPIFIHDADMRIVQANPAYCQRAGKPIEALKGELYYHHFPKRDQPLPACVSFPERLLDNGDELEVDGEKYISRSFGIHHGGGQIVHAIHILEDVTTERQAQAELSRRMSLERLIADLSADFVTVVDLDEMASVLDGAAERMRAVTLFDLGYVYRYKPGEDKLIRLHHWTADDRHITDEAVPEPDIAFAALPWLKAHLMGDNKLVLDDLGELPEEAAAERAEFERRGVRSTMVLPLIHRSVFIGYMGVDVLLGAHPWSESDLHLVMTVAELITNTLARIHAVEKVRKSEESLAAAQHIAHIGNWDWNIVTGGLKWSDEIYRIFGLEPHQFGATYEAFLATVHPDDRQFVIDNVDRAVAGETDYEIDHRIVLLDGTVRTVHEKGDVVYDEKGQPERMIGTVHDVTQARKDERELLRLNRALTTLSRCNTTLVHATDEQVLLHVICNILIESGGYHFAWVGFAEHDDAKTIRPVAYAGQDEGFLDDVTASWGDGSAGETPAGYAIRNAEPFVERDISLSNGDADWRTAALARGYASVISFPLLSQGELYGAITIDAAEPDAFDDRERALLQEMAGDLAFGVRTLKGREELRQAEERFEELYEAAPNAYLSVSAADGRLLQFNQALCDMLGYDRETLADMLVFDLYADGPEGKGRAKKVFDRFVRGEEVRDEELQMRTASGAPIWVSVSVDPVLDENGNVVESRSMAIDITARKTAEAEQKRARERLQRSLLQTIQAIALTIEKRDPYTSGHQERVAQLAVAIAEEMGLDQERIEGLRLGALIHDIGKISVPVEILNRPGKLDPAMFALIKTHPEIGHEIVKGIEFPWPLSEMVVQHHERLDGSGYPKGLKGGDILIEARILAVADVVEAMTSHRPYRPALGVEAALKNIEEGKGRLFDPNVVESCLRLYRKKPEDWPLS